jgi:hypothetical protein
MRLHMGGDSMINVNITIIAKKIIDQDRVLFNTESAKNEIPLSTFINQIISCSLSSQSLFLPFDYSLIHIKNKGSYFKIRLNKKIVEYFESKDIEVEDKIDSVPQYVKLVLETYAKLPFIRREEIILSDMIEKIKHQILKKEVVKFSTSVKNSKDYKVLPLLVASSKENTFRYLVAIDDTSHIISIRISTIRTPIDHCGLIIPWPSEEELTQIHNDLIEFGPTFAFDPKVEVRVKLTDDGVRDYIYSVIHRPIHVNRDNNVFQFKCSLRQAEFFFFRFCGDVEIIEPNELRDLFAKKYREGLKVYTDV